MTLLNEILEYNKTFVENREYENYDRNKMPKKRMVILTCMDTRLLELLPKAINVSNGDVKTVKNAGAIVSHPFGSIMRSILLAVYELQADEVFVIGHHDCGVSGLRAETVIESMKKRGISEDTLNTLTNSGIKFKKWLHGFDNVTESVAHSVGVIKNHPLMPADVPVHGLVIDPSTGKLDLVVEGYKN
ncbi:carbonic anhydrase [Neobacillus sp. PS3-40]|jgi:carbonic anhydrase|uniref:beta-class carbonic anhydrase n=1 Tax=Neobacillus sp. PS3-40 TaxID=3070679 RepID=UPI0027E0DD6D|nr:carbonic anhydrase [Neobacillus sp. PS3-40]WML45736.1 carbonic anhydrase [Neobacillus sp. PS3-40]